MELWQPWQNVNGAEQIFSGLCGNHNCNIYSMSLECLWLPNLIMTRLLVSKLQGQPLSTPFYAFIGRILGIDFQR